jgi:hypothetical protein
MRMLCACGLYCLVAVGTFLLPACSWDGHLRFFGYTTEPLHDPTIHSVRVPIFENLTYRRGLEFDLQQAIVREIEWKCPNWKVVQEACNADTELTGKIVSRTKAVTVVGNLGEIRQGETTMTVEVIWRDLRPGKGGDILSQPPAVKRTDPMPEPPPPGSPPPVAKPVIIQTIATFIPEVGQSLTSGEQEEINRLARQIVDMMEKPW